MPIVTEVREPLTDLPSWTKRFCVVVTTPARFLKGPVSNLDFDSGIPEFFFRDFPQSLRATAGILCVL
jgi:hypothetical protein